MFRAISRARLISYAKGISFLVSYFSIFEFSSISISPNPIVGVAHHVSFMRPYGLFDTAAVTLANSLTDLFPYVDSISEKLDYIGINYYGQVLLPLQPSLL